MREISGAAVKDVAEIKSTYDLVPYKSFPFPQSHPSRLSAIAKLFNLNPPNISTARILEIGCASGGNLLPLAEQYPESRCVGIDLSSRQIADGERLRQSAKLSNIQLLTEDVRTAEFSDHEFDYVICHGVFSWIPDDARDAILRLCQRHLSPNGIAYISYNTYPGWHSKIVLRDAMRYRTRISSSAEEQIENARNVVAFLASAVNPESVSYASMWKNEADAVARADDSYVFHEHLEAENQSYYFHEFIERAERFGLQYLAESDVGSMSLENIPDTCGNVLKSMANSTIEMEQYLDFLRNRTFRQTLLCRAGLPRMPTISSSALVDLWIASNAVPERDTSLDSGESTLFRRGNSTLRSNETVVKAAMKVLRESWPSFVPFRWLCARARSLAEQRPVAVESEWLSPPTQRLAEVMSRCINTGVIDVRDQPPSFTTEVTANPQATNLARSQASYGAKVTNRLHESVVLDDLQRRLLLWLDGTNAVADIVSRLRHAITTKELVMVSAPTSATDAEARDRTPEVMTHHVLLSLAQQALLVD